MPTLTRVTVVPDTVHTDAVVDVNVTASPDDAVAVSVNVPEPKALLGIVGKVMVWPVGEIVKLWLTEAAAAYAELPGCAAWMVHVPTVTSVTVLPETVQTETVDDVKITVSPEDAVALIVIGAAPTIWLERLANVIDWLCGVTMKLRLTADAAL
jgi:hypothetical protein